MFGGTVVPHCRDTDYLDPRRFDGLAKRTELGLSSKFVMMFVGSPRPHKGVAHLVEALPRLADLDPVLVIVGGGAEPRYEAELKARGGPRLRILPPVAYREVPEWLAAADAVVLPQLDSPAAIGQVPMKLFDAMAMAKPIVASAISDIPEILEGCGLCFAPGDQEGMVQAIRKVASSEDMRRVLGARARERCCTRYSYSHLRDVVTDLIET
jgi:glycosyltransferase involved in cell wall biosynthesis